MKVIGLITLMALVARAADGNATTTGNANNTNSTDNSTAEAEVDPEFRLNFTTWNYVYNGADWEDESCKSGPQSPIDLTLARRLDKYYNKTYYASEDGTVANFNTFEARSNNDEDKMKVYWYRNFTSFVNLTVSE